MANVELVFTEEEVRAMDAMVMHDEEVNRKKEIEKFKQELEEAKHTSLEQGIEQNKITMVKNMLKEKMSYDMIKRVSGLSMDKIKEISNI